MARPAGRAGKARALALFNVGIAFNKKGDLAAALPWMERGLEVGLSAASVRAYRSRSMSHAGCATLQRTAPVWLQLSC